MIINKHKPFLEIIEEIKEEQKNLLKFKTEIEVLISKLSKNNYWQNYVQEDFKILILESIKYFNTTIFEFKDISKDIKTEVKVHHINRLNKIANNAKQLHSNIGILWNKEYPNKDYENVNFKTVEQIYSDTIDTALTLMYTDSIATRLSSFIGKKSKRKEIILLVISLVSILISILLLLFGDNILKK